MTIGQTFGDAYRTLTQDQLVETLLLEGYAYEDDRDAARTGAKAAIARWIAGGLKTRNDPRGQLFDPVEAVCHAKAAGRRGDDDFWERRFVTTLRRFVTDLERESPAKVSVSCFREFNLAGAAPGDTKRLRMPLPLAGRYAGLEIFPELSPEVASHRLSDGRLEARVTVGNSDRVRIGARAEIVLGRLEAEAPPQGDAFLRPKDGLVVITPLVEALARRFDGTGSREAAIRNIWDYLLDNFVFCPIHYDQVPAEAPLDWVLQTGVYDCQLASALFTGICRALGIPARMVGGNFLYRRSPTNHFWAEAWIDASGWTPFDFLTWDLSCGGRDTQWRDRFFGQVEARLVTECLPTSFTGAVGVPIPAQWHILRTIEGSGVAIELTGLDGNLAYRDSIAIQ